MKNSSKSTPLSSLPTMQLPPLSTLQTIPSMSSVHLGNREMKERQQTALQNDVMKEDAMAIQEALEALNPQQQVNYPDKNVDSQGSQGSHAENANNQQEGSQEERYIYDPDVMDLIDMTPSAHPQNIQEIDMKTKLINDILDWNNDLKIALFSAGIFVLLYSIPIEKYVYKYIAFDKIPNSQLLIKTVLMFVGVLLVSKLML